MKHKEKILPNIEDLEKYLQYTPSTGKFKWLNVGRRWKCRMGEEAGYVNKRGYRIIGFKGKIYRAHRLAWYMSKKVIPSDHEVDHINGNKDDNRLGNLRVVTKQENAMNRKLPKTSTSGILGVYWHKKQEKWHAGVKIKGKQRYLGSFSTKEEAGEARLKANRKLNFHTNHGK